MKSLYMSLFIFIGFAMAGQSGEDVNPFGQAFQGMFNSPEPLYIPEGTPPVPPVPLDGGLTALLLAGGAAGYRQYKKRRG